LQQRPTGIIDQSDDPLQRRDWVTPQIAFDERIEHREPMEAEMNTNLTFGTGRFLHRTRLVLVNDRIPRTDGGGALCGRIIETGYVRDLQTRLIYCDTQCFAGEADMVMPVSKDRARKVS
jgi:hypothetical protein